MPKWQEEESSLPLTRDTTPSDTVVTNLSSETFMLQDSTKDDENNPFRPPLNPLPSREGKSPSPLGGLGWGEGEFSGQRFGKTCSSSRDSPLFQLAELSLADEISTKDFGILKVNVTGASSNTIEIMIGK
ncbi:MAG: hypothetical protein HZA07_01255 [Nitrospirae bacterium]|nr:hypothetical protein [Nitrospirota bacterium]